MERDQQSAIEAVLARMAELHMTPTGAARDGQIDPATVRDFLSGARWPQTSTQGRLESVLQWPPGAIEMIARGRPIPAVTPSGQGDVMLDLPPAIFEGMSPNQVDELKAGIRAEAWKRRREIMGE